MPGPEVDIPLRDSAPAAPIGLPLLVGMWRGRGVADFPTIERTGYEEELTVEWDAERELFCYVRRARLDDGSASHRETGFIAALPRGGLQLWNAQGNGRTEVLRGTTTWDEGADEYLIELASVEFGNDPRMLGSSRRLQLSRERIRYEMVMATTTAPSPDPRTHLTGELARIVELDTDR